MPQPIISADVLEKFPHYSGIFIYAHNIPNKPTDEFSSQLLTEAERHAQEMFSSLKPAEHPHLAAWREAYAAFGIKPNKMQNSAEALISRVVKGNSLPRINWLADVYNAISVRYALPIGGEDLDKAIGIQHLEFANGTEDFDTVKDGGAFIDHPQLGEVIWRDEAGVTCRAWNWRQCVRTRLTEQTSNAYFVLDSLAPFALEDLEKATTELETHIKTLSPECKLEKHVLGAYK